MRIKEQCIRMLWVICLLAVGPTIVLSENGSDYNPTNTSGEKISKDQLAISVSGTVTDAEGETLIGVNVQVKGTTVGTSTDFDGHYALDNVDEDAVLVFSYVGYQTREVGVEGRTVVDVVMESDAQLIDELVVVGYGTQRKSDLTGSVATVDIADLELAPVGSFDEALAGRVAGVRVISSDGQPGGGIDIMIRGVGSLTQSTSPLYVVDGFPIEGLDPKTLNPEDIASISVLKDASSTAIYGSRAVVDVSGSGAILSFNNAVQNGSQEDQLSILISTDFDGDTSSLASVKGATWIDITDQFSLATSSSFIPSGTLDISEYAATDPFYVAFRYITEPQMENGDARQWMIENFKITTRDTIYDNVLPIVNQNEIGFYVIDEDREHNPSRTSVTATRLSILGHEYADPEDPIYDPDNPIFDPNNPIYDPDSDVYDPTAERPEYMPYDPDNPYNDPRRETWVVSKPISTNEVNLGPDWSNGIRGIRDQKLVEFTYSYSNPGNYTAVFVGKNVTIDDEKESVQKIPITITP